MKRISVSCLSAVLACVACAQIEILAPAPGETVPLLTDAQKRYVAMSRAERRAKFADPRYRVYEMGLPAESVPGMEKLRETFWPKTVRLAWKSVADVRYRVTVTDARTGAVVFDETKKGGEAYVDNLEVAGSYNWKVEAGGDFGEGTFRTEDTAPRLVRFPGVANARDIGGYVGLGNRRIRQGLAIRTAGLNDNAGDVYYTVDELKAAGRLDEIKEAAAAAQKRLDQLLAWQKDPKTIDREDAEYKDWCLRHPNDPVTKFLSSRVHTAKGVVKKGGEPKVVKERAPGRNRVAGEKGEYIRTRFGVKSDVDLRSDRECFGMTGSPLGESVRWFHYSSGAYGGMQHQYGKDAFKKVFAVFLDERNYPIVFHCIGGQDRTGAVAFILEALLGVDEDVLYLDWELTGFRNRNASFCHEYLFDKLVDGFKKNYPAPTLAESVERYVLDLGFTRDDIEKFRSIMLEDAPASGAAEPLLAGFNPDPSICRVGSDYYLATSSFELFPGIPVYHSTDLVNWRLVSHAWSHPDFADLRAAGRDWGDDDGNWAPTIRHRDGTFYVTVTFRGKERQGNYLVTAKDPRGPWSRPVLLDDGSGIDPSLFFDDDGTCYLLANKPSPKKEWPAQCVIWAQKVDLEKGALVGPVHDLTTGTGVRPRYAEGPHIYKVGRRYYLLIAQGGTEYSHQVALLSSDAATGPYAPCGGGDGVVLTAVDWGEKSPLQAFGHADLVDTPDGRSFAVFLGKRMLADGRLNILGRETFMCPVEWQADGTAKFLREKAVKGAWRDEQDTRYSLMTHPDWNARFKKVKGHRETFRAELAPGESIVLYRSEKGYLARANTTGRTIPAAVELKGREVFFELDGRREGPLSVEALGEKATHNRFNGLVVGTWRREKEHIALARELAASGIVLLENKGGVLPLKPSRGVVLAGITGYYCHRMGWGSGDMLAHDPVQIDAGLEKAGVRLDAAFAKVYRDELARRDYSRLNRDWDKWTRRFDEPKFAPGEFAKIAAGKREATCVVVVGRGSGESADIPEAPGGWRLHAEEERLLADACAAFDDVVVVLNAPGVLDTSFMEKYPVKALVFAPYLGETTGDALAAVLTGKVNPSGKTVDTWPKRYRDHPNTDCWQTSEIDYCADMVSYNFFWGAQGERAPRYPFGYGLSYTTFELSPKKVAGALGGRVTIPVTVRNTGKVAGADVIQCWYSFRHESSIGRVETMKLCAFAKTPVIAPGAAETVALAFDAADVACYNEDAAQWEIPDGDYSLLVGDSPLALVEAAKGTLEDAIVVRKVTNRFRGKSAVRELKELKKPASSVAWADVLSRKATVEDLVAQFTDEELAAVVNGRLFDGQGYNVEGGTGVGGVKKGRVDCEAGETWSSGKYGFGAITMADGPSGVRLGNFNDPREKYNAQAADVVSWPCATALAQGWDVEAAERFGRAVADEMARVDIDCWLAPGVNIHRNPLCGRNFEYFSEDPLVAGLMGAAVVRGVQTNADGTPSGRSATVKHFAVNNQEFERGSENNVVDETTLREIYLKPFEIVVRRARPNMVMSSYCRLNGDYCATTYDLLTGVLRDEWGFDGFVMTDWWNAADKLRHAEAGNDLVMPGVRGEYDALVAALKEGKVRRAAVQHAAVNILTTLARIVRAQGKAK
ncbi:MAG: family 43 glycosylhydrolase [Kiritimatiellae bacterium]|nr:family 43 glycosylhydrolase [Kiritimatiellia bacterium]